MFHMYFAIYYFPIHKIFRQQSYVWWNKLYFICLFTIEEHFHFNGDHYEQSVMVSLLDIIIFTNNVPDIKQLWKLLMTTGINGMITHIGTNFVGFKRINVPVHYPRNFMDNWTGIRHHWSRNICLQMRFTLGWYSYFPHNYLHIATLFIASIKLILFVRNMNKRVIDNHYF